MNKSKFLIVMLVLATLTTAASAQVLRAKVAGTVKDENGQPMAGIYVIFHNLDNGGTYEMKTNAKGEYDGMVIATPVPSSNSGPQPQGYDVMLKRDKKDTEALATRKHVVVVLDPSTSQMSTSHSDANLVDFDLSNRGGGDSGSLTAEQKKKLAEYQTQKTAAETENKKRGNLNQFLSTARGQAASGNYEAAVGTMKQATEVGQNYALLWGQLGMFQVEQSRKTTDRTQRLQIAGDAVTALKKAVELCGTDAKQPGCAPADVARYHSTTGKALALSGKLDDAGPEYEQAAQMDPPNAALYYFSYGADLTNAGKPDDANKAFNKAITANPKYADAYLERGRNSLSKCTVDPKTGATKCPPETENDLKKYLELQPDGPHAPEAKAILQAMGEKVETTYRSGQKK